MNIRLLDANAPDFDRTLAHLTATDTAPDRAIEARVDEIIEAVRARGDSALLEYTRQFDRVDATAVGELEIGADEMHAALTVLGADDRRALQEAADRIRRFHEQALAQDWQVVDPDGTTLGVRVTPIDRVGIYVPGGKASYPSSVLMNAIPARVAGVAQIIMVAPAPDGARNPLVLAAAALAGVTRAFAVGGAQAVAALAYGTQTIPAVDKIVGPGNAYVAAAKRRVFGTVGIDMLAGPSEILIICDGTTDPDWIAMDLFSQAEHDEMAQAILLTPDPAFRDAVLAAVTRLLPTMPRRQIIETSLRNRGALVLVRDLEQACEIANRIAPEHLEISTAAARRWIGRIRHAGAIFLGPYASEALGDYCAGPNHVLPTSRTARFSSPLGVSDFQKRSSVIEISEAGAKTLGATASRLAHGEGLGAHARSAEMRMVGSVPPRTPRGQA
ncbi:bifunctional histidinal dehydrogenase and histidinol dehydrogenase [Burkholderiales bacterium]|nr:bifunctional histidinal dehydrogenase and histidinol dehydrogenase [Burkholderiales bacterium]